MGLLYKTLLESRRMTDRLFKGTYAERQVSRTGNYEKKADVAIVHDRVLRAAKGQS